jgi:endonuclease YncB( thermonuclease family)
MQPDSSRGSVGHSESLRVLPNPMSWVRHPCSYGKRFRVVLAFCLCLASLESCQGRLSGSESCRVERVRDGDSLTLQCGPSGHLAVEVRLWGIDAPELGQNPWGDAARRRLQQLATGRVTLVPVDRDSYGRVVARIYRSHRDLGLELVREGYAAIYWRYNDDQEYYRAGSAAKRKQLGIWSRPGLQQTPWRWRAQHPRQ